MTLAQEAEFWYEMANAANALGYPDEFYYAKNNYERFDRYAREEMKQELNLMLDKKMEEAITMIAERCNVPRTLLRIATGPLLIMMADIEPNKKTAELMYSAGQRAMTNAIMHHQLPEVLDNLEALLQDLER